MIKTLQDGIDYLIHFEVLKLNFCKQNKNFPL